MNFGSSPSPDFTLSASPTSRTVVAGQNTSYTVSVGSIAGFGGNVSLGDEKLLTFALDELIENALRATEEDDLISITGTHEGDTAVIEIADSGIGIRPEDLDQVFEQFSRSTLSRRRGGRGTGLGLPIVKAIVEAHGGWIEVDSEPGRGTTFRIGLDGFQPRSLPAAPALAGDLVGTPS
jgi:signal transduction histidine kinase